MMSEDGVADLNVSTSAKLAVSVPEPAPPP